ncbi:MAG: right-handed parallel beta-helix repeat-containing protein, partial [Sedimentisphaerales bacterium]|nr:right-handed parallel beta-helix repeat-containing protein [Sedimentisphaerales bacterium]
AAPHVSGACALVWSLDPDLVYLDVKNTIMNTVDKTLPGLCVSEGRLNLYNALWEAACGILDIDIYDNISDEQCVEPDDTIIYTIEYGNPIMDPCNPFYIGDVNDVIIANYLPKSLTVVSADPCGTYNSAYHVYTWDIASLPAGTEDGVTLTVTMNDFAEPNDVIENWVVISDFWDEHANIESESTKTCCWNYGVIFVDQNAQGANTGVSWEDAYTDLQHALSKAKSCYRDEIWVAQGIYKPTYDPDDNGATFELVEDVKLYGGFNGFEEDKDERRPLTNTTYLTGDIDGDRSSDIDYVVSDLGVNPDTVMDGFIIGKSREAGIYVEGGSAVMEHNTVRENDKYGIYLNDPNNVSIKNCWIHNNENHGIYLADSGHGGDIRNCTIFSNTGEGIHSQGANDPNVISSILYKNNSEGNQFTNCNVTYSCYKIPGEPNSYEPDPVTCNIHCDPNFIFEVFDDPNAYTFYLKPDSPCIDKGDNKLDYEYEVDLNFDDRVLYEQADMGADEFSSPVCGNSLADFDSDDIVMVKDFNILAASWLTENGDPDWNSLCDLNSDNQIAIADMEYFCGEWLMMECPLLRAYIYNGIGTGMPPLPLGGGTMSQSSSSQWSLEDILSLLPGLELPLAERIARLESFISDLEFIWETDEEFRAGVDLEQWQDIMNYLNNMLDDLLE